MSTGLPRPAPRSSVACLGPFVKVLLLPDGEECQEIRPGYIITELTQRFLNDSPNVHLMLLVDK